MRLQVAYEEIHLNRDVKVYVQLSLCVIWCVHKSPACVDTDTHRHQVEFVLVPFCRISLSLFFLFVFCSYGRKESWPSLSQRDANLSLSLSQSSAVVQPLRKGQTAGAELFWALLSTRTHTHLYSHTMLSHNIPTHNVCTCMNFIWYFTHY